METNTMDPQQMLEQTPAPQMADPAAAAVATEALDILTQNGFVALANLLQEGKLSERQIAARLSIPRGQAKKMLADAMTLLIQHGINLPAPERPAQSRKAKSKLSAKLKARRAEMQKKLAARKAKKSPARDLVTKIVEVKTIATVEPSSQSSSCCVSPEAMSMMRECLGAMALSDPAAAIGILTRYASQRSLKTPAETGKKLAAACT